MRLFEGTPFDIPPSCDRCEKLETDCECAPLGSPVVPPGQQLVHIAVEKRKRGKMVTVVRGLANEPAQLADLLSTLKSKCGGGGTVKDDAIEVQGNHVGRVQELLTELGYRVHR